MSWQDEKRVCALEGCEVEFYPEAHNQKYCSEQHKQTAENKRFYQRHKADIVERNTARRKARKAKEKANVKR